MKCIRNTSTDKVDRVTDEVAKVRVEKGDAIYVPKKVWREETRDEGKE